MKIKGGTMRIIGMVVGVLLLIPSLVATQTNELVSEFTYNQKVYDLGNGNKNYKIHIAQIHYKDNNGNFKDIDTRLSKNILTGNWHHEKASYNPVIPEYADEILEFKNVYEGADFTLQFKPISNHIKGQYIEAEDGNYVLYPNAFGQDIDLKAYSYWAGIKKVICVNKPPADLTKDLTFDFEIVLSSLIGLSILKNDDTQFDFSKTGQLDFTDKTIRLGKDGKYTYFRNALMWDSFDLSEKVTIKLVKQGAKLFIRKTIPAAFLQKAVFPIYTDHPTSYYTGAGDGTVFVQTTSPWDAAHDALNGSGANPTGTLLGALSGLAAGTFFNINRCFLPVDTSGIDDGATITAATLNLYVTAKNNGDNDGDDWINVVGETTQPDPTTLTTADYDLCGSVNNPTEGATRIDIGSITTSAYNTWTLNSTGIGWIDKVNVNGTLLGLREGHDCIDSPIVGSGAENSLTAASSEDTSGTKDPYLEVTVSGGAAVDQSQVIMIM